MTLLNEKKQQMLSLVVPVYFEEECILQFIEETEVVLNELQMEFEIVFVDDGSTDKTVELIKQAAEIRPFIKLIELSYNHGKQAAVTAAITFAKGDYLIAMDPDLQDPPEEILRFIEEIEKGYDLVLGIRKEKVDGLINKFFSKIFWILLARFSGLKIPIGISSMRIFNRKFANKFLEYPEQNRFLEGLFMHIGMKRSEILIEQRDRFAGKSKFNFNRKMRLAFDAIFDFSEVPLKISIRVGFVLLVLGFLYCIGIVITKLFIIDFQLGWPSLMCAIIIASGTQLFLLGIVALYIGRIYKESKKRPLFAIKEFTNF